MKSKILLLSLPFEEQEFYKLDYFSKTKQAPLFPFGIAYIATYLQQHGCEVDVLDIYARQMTREEVHKSLVASSFDAVGISALVTQYMYVKWLAEEIKSIKDVPIILGNGLATSCYQLVLENIPAIDVCVRGEGELAMLRVLENMPALSQVNGIAYRSKDSIVVNPSKNGKELDIDALMPAYDKFDMKPYMKAKIYETGLLDMRVKYADRAILPMLSSRGCPYSCNFCGKVIPQARLRKVSSVISEVEYLKERYGITGVHFIDELFAVNKARAVELATALKPLKIIWDCQARVNTIDFETMKVMKDAGCVAIGFGIESGSQTILDNMNKRITVRQIESVMTAAIKINLPVKVQLIFGYPGESEQTIGETVDLFKRIGHPARPMSAIVPLPGTSLWEYAKVHGMVKDSELWLCYISHAFETNGVCVNFTEFGDVDLNQLRKKYDTMIGDNYYAYLCKHPLRMVNDIRHYKSLLLPLIAYKLQGYKGYNHLKALYHFVKGG